MWSGSGRDAVPRSSLARGKTRLGKNRGRGRAAVGVSVDPCARCCHQPMRRREARVGVEIVSRR